MDEKIDIAHELGDVLWMLTATANDLGFDLDDIAQMNLSKLRDRRLRVNCEAPATTAGCVWS